MLAGLGASVCLGNAIACTGANLKNCSAFLNSPLCCRWFVADGPLTRQSVAKHASGETPSELSTLPPQEVDRVILLRGVVWQGKEVNAFKMWQDLMRFWPTPFAPEHTKAPDQMYAHAGDAPHFHRWLLEYKFFAQIITRNAVDLAHSCNRLGANRGK